MPTHSVIARSVATWQSRTPKPAHLPANSTDNATKTLPPRPHHRPNALLELAEMRGNEREIDLSTLNRTRFPNGEICANR